jgi:hypothetical protein
VPAACALSPVLIVSVGFGSVESGTGSHERGDSVFVYRKAAGRSPQSAVRDRAQSKASHARP